jgi:hypothetical protein
MSPAERHRRFLDKIRGTETATPSSLLKIECAKLERECAKLKSENTTLNRLLDGAEKYLRKLEARRNV